MAATATLEPTRSVPDYVKYVTPEFRTVDADRVPFLQRDWSPVRNQFHSADWETAQFALRHNKVIAVACEPHERGAVETAALYELGPEICTRYRDGLLWIRKLEADAEEMSVAAGGRGKVTVIGSDGRQKQIVAQARVSTLNTLWDRHGVRISGAIIGGIAGLVVSGFLIAYYSLEVQEQVSAWIAVSFIFISLGVGLTILARQLPYHWQRHLEVPRCLLAHVPHVCGSASTSEGLRPWVVDSGGAEDVEVPRQRGGSQPIGE